MLKLVISGGQTGADQAGWRAARKAAIPTGGWMPKGFRTEDGPRPDFAELYGARETISEDYPSRTAMNVADSALTLWFGRGDTAGYWCTRKAANQALKPFLEIPTFEDTPPKDLARRIALSGYETVNVAGNRGSKMQDGGQWVEDYLSHVFAMLPLVGK